MSKLIGLKYKLVPVLLICFLLLNICMPIVFAYSEENNVIVDYSIDNSTTDDVIKDSAVEDGSKNDIFEDNVIENESGNINKDNIVENESSNINKDNIIENNNSNNILEDGIVGVDSNENLNNSVDNIEDGMSNNLIDSGVEKGESYYHMDEGNSDVSLLLDEAQIIYRTHVQNDGWQDWKGNGDVAGTENRGLRLEAININLAKSLNFNIKYQVHVQSIGWQNWKKNGELAGTEGHGFRLEAIKILLESSDDYSVMYRVHIQNIGWQDWKTDGEIAGTEGQGLRLEAIQIKVVKKQKRGLIHLDTAQNGATYYSPENIVVSGWKMANVSNTRIKVYIDNNAEALDDSLITYTKRDDVLNSIENYGTAIENQNPGFSFTLNFSDIQSNKHSIVIMLVDKYNQPIQGYMTTINIDLNLYVAYRAHVQNWGWQDWGIDGNLVGTEGQSLRIEALNIKLLNAPSNAGIKYKLHVQNIGWQNWAYNGDFAGTEGSGFRVEAIKILLENMDDYTIEYQVHIQDIGWSTWYIDGEIAGTIGQGKRIEAIRMRIVPKYKREYYGIDVSMWQNEIDFNKVVNTKKVDFIIARAGWYSESRGKFMVDSYFERNYRESKSRNIPIGTYIYSYATNVNEARNEANGLVNYLLSTGQTDFNLPIFFDIEDSSQVNIDKQTQTDMCKAFGEILKAHGFRVGIYSSKNWLLNKIDLNQIPDDYSLWVASYSYNDNGSMPSPSLKFPGDHDIWQYSSKGTIDGIEGYVDMNVCYKKLF